MKIREKLIILFSVITAMVVLTVSLPAYYYTRHTVVNSIESEMSAIVSNEVQAIDSWLSKKTKVLENTANLISRTVAGGEIPVSYLQAAEADKDIRISYIGLSDGRFINSKGETPSAGYDPRTRGWYKQALETKEPIYSEPYIDDYLKDYVVSAAIQLRDENGNIRGVLGQDIHLVTLSNIAKNVNLHGKGYGFIVDSNGVLLAHPDKELLSGKLSELPAFSKLAANMLVQDYGIETYSENDVSRIMLYKKMPSTGWVMGITVSEAEAYAELSQLRTKIIMVNIAAVFLVAVVAFFIAGKFTRALNGLAENARKFATGNLTVTMEVAGKDEIAVVAAAFNQMGMSLRTLIREINSLAHTVDTTASDMQVSARKATDIAEQIAITVDDLAAGAGTHSESVQQGALLVEKVNKAITLVTEAAAESASMAAKVEDFVGKGYQDVANQMELMHRSKAATTGVGQAIAELADNSQKIGQIVEVITSIAGQTNLLALNAAIEAARAGEQGRGFAVVAEEVRKLAEQSAASSRQIADLIREIQLGTDRAVKEIGMTETTVTEQEQAVAHLTEQFNDIKHAIANMATRIQQVASGTQAINAEALQVGNLITDIAAVSEESAASTEEVAAATNEQQSRLAEIATQADALLAKANMLKTEAERFII
ncbi:methyl-accepting chemotaxis protein [Sporomusa sphaeroides]|uniref:methyl-accepting chemotaxis protein n=1 Tax=Sporomusa sphaeroides TaxID=47679 RepID=UPI002B901816|nr:methyl-accepting chemotaxis protein [Sporomusa sphaeroides]HML35687.1 methyl-accepting chemotaxis protein [Sporomusa sphaeroides]